MNRASSGLFERLRHRFDRQVTEDANAARLLESLDGRCIRIEVEGIERSFGAAVTREGVRLAEPDAEPDVTISAPLSVFLAMAIDGPESDGASGLKINGDLKVAQRFQALLPFLAPDWESLLAEAIGDMPARGVGEVAGRAHRWALHAMRALGTSTSDYLRYEGRKVASRLDLDYYGEEVARLRDDVERLEARLRQVEARPRRTDDRALRE